MYYKLLCNKSNDIVRGVKSELKYGGAYAAQIGVNCKNGDTLNMDLINNNSSRLLDISGSDFT